MPMTTEEMIAWIDSASYEDLLRKRHFAPLGDPFFRKPVADHFALVMEERRREVCEAVHVAACKALGWDSP